MIRAVIFDIDGTLLDSVDAHARAWVDAFAHFGKSVPFDQARSQIGKGGDQLLPVFLSKEEIDRFGGALETWRGEHFKRAYLPAVRPFPQVRALFECILESGKKIALASSAKGDELGKYREIAGISDLVGDEQSTSSADAARSKPHPDIFVAALEKLGDIQTDEVIVVGDTPYDAEGAARAGLQAVGVLCGGFPEADLRSAGCIAIYQGPADLLARLDAPPLV